jgi:hypothetical protein
LTDDLVDRWFWSPGRQLLDASRDSPDNSLSYAYLGGQSWEINDVIENDFLPFYGSEVDLSGEWVVAGGPEGVYPSKNVQGSPDCVTDTLRERAGNLERGVTVLASFDSPDRLGPSYEYRDADVVQELVAMNRFEFDDVDKNYAPLKGFGECVKIEDGVIYSSLSTRSDYFLCVQGDDCIVNGRLKIGNIHAYEGLIDPTDCVGDFNGDGMVDGADFGSMLVAWGPCVGCPEDLDGDGIVNGADIGLLLAFWGPCG